MENIMSLPKIEHPIFKIKIPSSKREVRFRPFLVKEEKILLIAKTSEQENDILLAIKQVVNNCALDDLNIDKLALFDVEYLFLRIRAQSVNNIVSVTYRDNEDSTDYDFDIDLNNVNVVFPLNLEKTIKLTETSGIVMKYPEASLYEDKDFMNSGEEAFYQLVLRCIEKFYDADNVYDTKNYTMAEVSDYVDNLDVRTFDKVRDFILNQPKLNYVIEYKNKLGNKRQIELTSLTDFFTLR
jgi:hypothetical protein